MEINKPHETGNEISQCSGSSCNSCKDCNYNFEENRGLPQDWKRVPAQLYAAEAQHYFFYYIERSERLLQTI